MNEFTRIYGRTNNANLGKGHKPAMIKLMKSKYPKNTRIRVIWSNDKRIHSRVNCTVLFVDDKGSLHCRLDNGDKEPLILVPESDRFEKIDD